MVIARHDQEFDKINATLVNTNATLDRVAAQQEAVNQRIEAMERQSAINQEAIATLTASIQDLRNLVADSIQGRSNS